MTDLERSLLDRLALCPDGETDALLVEQGLDFDLISRLLRQRLANAVPERAAGKPVEVNRVRITDAGRRALAEADKCPAPPPHSSR
jgi:hypothetical protein